MTNMQCLAQVEQLNESAPNVESNCKPLLELNINNAKAIFLNHRTALQELYENHLANNDVCYKLKKQLFHFNAHNSATTITQHEAEVLAAKSKPCECIENSTEAEEIMRILVELRKIMTFAKDTVTTVLPRSWEEPVEFPRLNGANATSKIQMFSLEERAYIIPPHCCFYNYDVADLQQLVPALERYDLLVMDPPWRNKYIRRLKRARQCLAYKMLYNHELAKMPIQQLIHHNTIVAIWCTNSQQHQSALEEELLPSWHLKVLQKLKWLKLNTHGKLIGELNPLGKKQPYEMLYLAVHRESAADFCSALKTVQFIASIPSIIHSHKPPLLNWLAAYLPKQPKCLELFGRYLQPHFTTIGLEVLKLMDSQLYTKYAIIK